MGPKLLWSHNMYIFSCISLCGGRLLVDVKGGFSWTKYPWKFTQGKDFSWTFFNPLRMSTNTHPFWKQSVHEMSPSQPVTKMVATGARPEDCEHKGTKLRFSCRLLSVILICQPLELTIASSLLYKYKISIF